jgi:hypothetical protein
MTSATPVGSSTLLDVTKSSWLCLGSNQRKQLYKLKTATVENSESTGLLHSSEPIVVDTYDEARILLADEEAYPCLDRDLGELIPYERLAAARLALDQHDELQVVPLIHFRVSEADDEEAAAINERIYFALPNKIMRRLQKIANDNNDERIKKFVAVRSRVAVGASGIGPLLSVMQLNTPLLQSLPVRKAKAIVTASAHTGVSNETLPAGYPAHAPSSSSAPSDSGETALTASSDHGSSIASCKRPRCITYGYDSQDIAGDTYFVVKIPRAAKTVTGTLTFALE